MILGNFDSFPERKIPPHPTKQEIVERWKN
jgi:hypothetical protein